MKSFRQLINEALGLFESNYAARQDMVNVGRELARATAQKQKNNTPVTNNTPDIDIEPDTDNNLNKILRRLTPDQRGDLIGDCINTYRDFKNINYISVFVEKAENANYFLSDISDKKIKKDAKTGYDNIIISRNYINKHFPIVNARTVLKKIIHELKSRKAVYQFGSYADPMPHNVTEDMITNHKVFDEEVTTTFNQETRLKETKKTRNDTGKTKDVIGLTLYTEMSGGGISKKEGVMGKTSQGRRTRIVSNEYHINQSPDCCVQVEGLPVYVFSLKRSKNIMFESINLENYLIEASSVTNTKGSIKNVYIRQKSDNKTIFTHSKFLSHLARTINLAIRDPKTLIKNVPEVKLPQYDRSTYERPSDDLSHLVDKTAFTHDRLKVITDNRIKNNVQKKYDALCIDLYNKLAAEYYPEFNIPNDVWAKIPQSIRDKMIKTRNDYKKKQRESSVDVKYAFGRPFKSY